MADPDADTGGAPGTSAGSQSSAFARMQEPGLPARIGPYRILRKLGAGGMGEVYEGLLESIERRVAIKILHARYSRDPETTSRFINEARAVNRIAHPGVVQIFDHGQLEDGSAYIVMELLSGESLARRLHRSGALPVGECIDLATQVAEALAAAHARGIIHRDLKPDNIMIVPDRQMLTGERTKLLDFGIAKLSQSGERSKSSTQTSAFLGTPSYMSPEQAQGSGKVDAQTDVYSLGVILYEVLAGKRPFEGEGIGDLIVKHMSEPPPPLREHAPGCPPELVALIERMLAKDRSQRPTMPQCAALLDAMREHYPRPRPRKSQAMPVISAALPEELARPSTLGRAASQAVSRTPKRVAAATLVLACLFALGVALRFRQERAPASREPSGPAALPLAKPPERAVLPPLETPAVAQPGPQSPGDGRASQTAAVPIPSGVSAAPAPRAPFKRGGSRKQAGVVVKKRVAVPPAEAKRMRPPIED